MNEVQNNRQMQVRQEFGAMQTVSHGVESASTAVAAQAKAMVEARYIMAMQRPRNWDQVRQDLMRECRRPTFAHNKSAFYRKPIGNGVEGLGIRFVEVALRCMTNVLVETTMVFEDEMKEVHRVSVTDLESNLTYPFDVRVAKTVERSKPLDDGSYISVRTNSHNRPVYTVPANDEDLLNKRGAMISKALRTLGLRIIPGDMQDEAIDIIKQVRTDEASKDPDRQRKILADIFSEIGVRASDLAAYLGHDIGTCSPKEIVELKAIHGAIADGEATWKEVMENRSENSTGKKSGHASTPYPDDKFAASLPKWRKLIADGKQTADQVIAVAQSGGQQLTTEQVSAIRAPSATSDSAVDNTAITGLKEKAAKASISESEIAKHLNVGSLDNISVAQIEQAMRFIDDPMAAQQ